MRALFAGALALSTLALSACGSDDAAPIADAGAPVAAPPPPPTVVDTASGDTLLVGAAQPSPERVTISALAEGDRACVVDVIGAAGARTELADFDFCERDDLIGQQVTLTYVPTTIQAASCEGRPDCRATEEVRLVIAADPVIDGVSVDD